jgi:hypothetical protein
VTLRWTRLAALAAMLAGTLHAQQPAPGDSAVSVQAGILTIGPGAEVWELWGHNTIVLADRADGSSKSYNWGLFDFHQEDFILRFARGKMWYSMGSRPTDRDVALYAYRDRSMVLQALALTRPQADSLRAFLLWNDTEANRHYHYNYYLDNCSTRVRDAIDRALGGQLRRQFDTVPSGHTWRWETRRILGGNLPLYIAVNLALGHPVDTEMTAWQSMFLPVRLEEYLRTVQVSGLAGPVPLVRAEEQLNVSRTFREATAPARTWPVLLALGVLGGAMLALLGALGRTSRAARRVFGTLAAAWSFVAGVLGVVLIGLWFFTDHWSAGRNENVLLLTPLSLGLVVLLPLALKTPDRWRAAAGRLALLVASLSVLALAIKALPWFHQYNLELIGLILPVHLGLRVGLMRATMPS